MDKPSFEAVWQKLQSRLKPGMSIPNWTILKGYTGSEIKVAEIHQTEAASCRHQPYRAYEGSMLAAPRYISIIAR